MNNEKGQTGPVGSTAGSAECAEFLKLLLEQTQGQIDELKPKVAHAACKDDYEHGWNNGAFFVWVELRRALKEVFPNTAGQTPRAKPAGCL